MFDPDKAFIIFHIIEEEISSPPPSLDVYFTFDSERMVNTDSPFELYDKYFSVVKDQILTYIILNIDEIQIKFLITLYYAINHITIYKSKNIGVLYEIIQQLSYEGKTQEIEDISFDDYKNNKIKITNSDDIGNKFRKRFLIVNCPLKIDLPINFNNLKENKSYKVVILPENNILVHEIKEKGKDIKENIDLDKFLLIQKRIEKLIKEKYDKDEMESIANGLKDYDSYFNQNLINKGDYEWKYEELNAFYFYHIFHLFKSSKTERKNVKMDYFQTSLKIFENNYFNLFTFFELNIYDKILAIKSLYSAIVFDSRDDENSVYITGKYELMVITNPKYQCYEYVFKFINQIIDNLKEESFIFLPLLQVNSGSSIDFNSIEEKKDNKKENEEEKEKEKDKENKKEEEKEKEKIFELSMLNVEMIKRHLKYLMPKFIYRVNHKAIRYSRGVTIPNTGVIFIYETSIFNNNINYKIEDYMIFHPKDAAINISFTFSHEMFMNKKLKAGPTSEQVNITPTKFIGKNLQIKSFFYTDKKNFFDILAVRRNRKKRKNNLNEFPKKGESGRMMEYFFEKKDIHGKDSRIIFKLKTYLGFGDLLNQVGLIVDRNPNKLHEYVNEKIKNGVARPLMEIKILNKKRERSESNNNSIKDKENDFNEEDGEIEDEKSDSESNESEDERYYDDTHFYK